jgi:hypothetical protein
MLMETRLHWETGDEKYGEEEHAEYAEEGRARICGTRLGASGRGAKHLGTSEFFRR